MTATELQAAVDAIKATGRRATDPVIVAAIRARYGHDALSVGIFKRWRLGKNAVPALKAPAIAGVLAELLAESEPQAEPSEE